MTSSAQRSSTVGSVESLLRALNRTETDRRPIVLMTCGIAGSGKTTLAKSVIQFLPHFNRLSMDEIVFENHGLYGVDYPADDTVYQAFLEEADEIYMTRLTQFLAERKDAVAEKSFWSRQERDEYKKVVEDHGGRWILVYLPVEKEVLWKRICERSARKRDANSALRISRDLFEVYWAGFEHPDGEGEIVLKAEDGLVVEGLSAATGSGDPRKERGVVNNSRPTVARH